MGADALIGPLPQKFQSPEQCYKIDLGFSLKQIAHSVTPALL